MGVRRRVLGVDPGTVITGWGVVEESDAGTAAVASGVVRLRGARAVRLAEIHRVLCEVCEEHGPATVVVEKSFVGDNVQTAFRLGEARGAAFVAAAQAGLPVHEYSPAEIKMAVTGSGRADKTQMQAMVEKLLHLTSTPVADEADALAAAICHLQHERFADAVGGGVVGRRRTRRGRSRSMVAGA